MQRRFSQHLLILTVSPGLWLCGSLSISWGQTCPVKQGCNNSIAPMADYATISGGVFHSANGDHGTIGGGRSNEVWEAGTVSGGYHNLAGIDATTGGGRNN